MRAYLAAGMDENAMDPEHRCYVYTQAEDDVIMSQDVEKIEILAEEKGGKGKGDILNALRLIFLADRPES
jgi:hypothetical protein